MDYILRNKNTWQLYHTSGNIYQLLIQTFSSSLNMYFPINSMIIIFQLIMLFLPSIVHILNFYFDFINQSWLLNSKWRPRQILLNRYRKWLYWRKIQIRKLWPTNNQMLENTNKATRSMTKQHPKINWYLLSNLRCFLAPKNHRRFFFDTYFFNICANYGASSCATPDEIDIIPDTYKHLTRIAINGITEGHKICRLHIS